MPAFGVSKSIEIAASKETIFELVRDFRRWPEWSPWLRAEADCPLVFAPDGESYEWNGKIIGAGKAIRVASIDGQQIDLRLEFIRPFKSTAEVTFSFEETSEGTRVTWEMAGSLPFFLFWMKPMMVGFIGMDYDNGLQLLKDLAEAGSVPLKLEFVGVENYPAAPFLGRSGEASLTAVGPVLQREMELLGLSCDEAGISPEGPPFSIYHEFNPGKDICTFTVGVPFSGSLPSTLDPGIRKGQIQEGNVYKTIVTGPYRHLGTAWSAAMTHARSKVFPWDKKSPPFEIYESDPSKTEEEDIRTVILIPAK
ncbi:MAG: SRPBCC family protein [Verrucomicrobiota bacterium]